MHDPTPLRFHVEEDFAGHVTFEIDSKGRLRISYDGETSPVTMTVDFDQVLNGLKDLDARDS